MATGRDNDVLPVRKQTKAALTAVKGPNSYDEMLAMMLEVLPPDELRVRLDARQASRIASVAARRRAPSGGPRRSAEKQLMIARLAEAGWQRWLRDGRVVRLGPRRYRWNVASERPASEVTIRALGRPGRPPPDGPRSQIP